jgi:hypothetical protein
MSVILFLEHPFVLLNGCETGTLGLTRTNENFFPGIFLDAGAAAVIATEAPIWDPFGLGFATCLVNLLQSGTPVGEALLRSRLYYLETVKNPLGLIYSLYGNSSASFSRPVANRVTDLRVSRR